jgi:Transglutaminase-like superfamily
MLARRAELRLAAPSGTADVRRLGAVERVRLATEVVVAYVQARRALRRAPIASVVASLRSQSPHVSASASDVLAESTLAEARRLGWAVGRTLKLVPGDTRCLVRSLVLTRLLARRGIPGKLVIGARTAPDFLAHAWVECAGDPVLSPGEGSYGRLIEL